MAQQLAVYKIGLLVDVSHLRVDGGRYDYLDESGPAHP